MTILVMGSCILLGLILECWIGHCGNHPFGYHVNHLLKNTPRALIGGQTTMQDLPF